MLLNRSHRRWIVATVATSGALIGAGCLIGTPIAGHPIAASVAGIGFGLVATVLLLLTGLLAVRKWFPSKRFGSVRFWMRMHIWLGLQSILAVLLHCNFYWGGTIERGLMICFAIVCASGIFGLVLQQLLPNLVSGQSTRETLPQKIPQRCRRFVASADHLVADACGKLRGVDPTAILGELSSLAVENRWVRRGKEEVEFETYLERVYGTGESNAPQNPATRLDAKARDAAEFVTFYCAEIRPFLFHDRNWASGHLLCHESTAASFLKTQLGELAGENESLIESLEEIIRQRCQFSRLRVMHRILHGWLLIHVPVSVTMFVLLFLHIFTALRVIP